VTAGDDLEKHPSKVGGIGLFRGATILGLVAAVDNPATDFCQCASPSVDEVIPDIDKKMVLVGDESLEGTFGELHGFLRAKDFGGSGTRRHDSPPLFIDVDEVKNVVIQSQHPPRLTQGTRWIILRVIKDNEAV
jgi:hypothetical protein